MKTYSLAFVGITTTMTTSYVYQNWHAGRSDNSDSTTCLRQWPTVINYRQHHQLLVPSTNSTTVALLTTIRCNTTDCDLLTCAKKLMASQLNLPHGTITKQASADADGPARRAASRPKYWTTRVINWWRSSVELSWHTCDGRQVVATFFF